MDENGYITIVIQITDEKSSTWMKTKNKNKNKNWKNDVAGLDWCQSWPPIEPVHKTSKPQKNSNL
jgi:hypothetical protein